MKRIVTGHSPDGKAIVLHAGDFTNAAEDKVLFWRLWKTKAPVDLPYTGDDSEEQIYRSMLSDLPKPGETKFTFGTFPGNTEGHMHATDTVDYVVIVSGEIWLVLEDGSDVHLTAGDCVVQNGTVHAFHNRTSEPCTLGAIMVGATMNDVGG